MSNNHSVTPSWFEDFKKRIIDGIANAEDMIQRTAAIYVEAITKDPTFKDWITDEVPQVSGGIWRTLEMVGRGQLDARIAAGGCPYGNKLRRLPMSEQKQALDGTLPFLTASGDTLNMRLDAMMPAQAEQVFANSHIRSLSEQKGFQEAQAIEKAKDQKVKKTHCIEVNKKKQYIVVNGAILTRNDLEDYLRKIGG